MGLTENDDLMFYGLIVFPLAVLVTIESLLHGWTHLVNHWESKKPFEELPMPPHNHWLFGHVQFIYDGTQFPANQFIMVKDHANPHGQTGFWLGHRRAMAVTQWQDARDILKHEQFRRTVPLVSYYLKKSVGENSIVVMNGVEWKRHRSAITKTFSSTFLKTARRDVVHVSRTLVQALQDKLQQHIKDNNKTPSASQQLQLNIQPIMKMVTMDVFGKSAFGTDLDCCKTLTISPIAQAFEWLATDVSDRMKSPLHPFHYWYSIPTRQNQRQKQAVKVVHSFLDAVLDKAKANANNTTEHQNLIAALLQVHGEDTLDDNNIDVDDTTVLKDVLMTLVFAGYDTTSTTLTFALYLLAQHPQQQELCVQEIRQLVTKQQHSKSTSTSAGLDNPDQLVYCGAVVQETLRLYPSAFQSSRTLVKPKTLSGGFVAPAGTHVAIPIWVIHRHEQNFDCPNDFRPDRWVRPSSRSSSSSSSSSEAIWEPRDYHAEQEMTQSTTTTPTTSTTTSTKGTTTSTSGGIAAGNPDAMLAFSAGARSCPGAKFAFQEAVLVLANLLQELKFLPVPGHELKMQLKGVLPNPVGGMPLRMEKRQS